MKHKSMIQLALAALVAAESLGAVAGNFAEHGAPLPVQRIQEIVGAEGEMAHGVLEISISRNDLGTVPGPVGINLTPAFELHGDLRFQPLSRERALLNADMALTEEEVNPFVSTLLRNGLVFQAFHQHMPTQPQIWFVHYRGIGTPEDLAMAVRAALDATSVPLPQTSPANPTTPLNADRLASILHGDASVGEDGVVTVTVPRTSEVTIDGVHANPYAGISTTIEFKPIGKKEAQVVPDFSLTAQEIDPVVKLMLNELDWYQGCLYNQETAESPQLYFDHMIKQGNAYALAKEIRRGLDLTQSR